MTLFEPKKARSRRNEIRGEVRRDRPGVLRKAADYAGSMRGERRLATLAVAVCFATIVAGILMLRPRVVSYRPGQVTNAPVFARGSFTVLDEQRLGQARQRAADAKARVYRPADKDPFTKLEDELLASPGRLTGLSPDLLATPGEDVVGLAAVLDADDGAALARLQEIAADDDVHWARGVRLYVEALRGLGLILLPADAAIEDGRAPVQLDDGRVVAVTQRLALPADEATKAEIERRVAGAAFEAFGELIYPKVVAYTGSFLGPTVVPDLAATARVRAEAADRVPALAGEVIYREGQRLLPRGHRLSEADWQLLRAENEAFRESLGNRVWFERSGLAGLAMILTVAMSAYVVRYRPKIAANPSRAAGLATLLLGCLLIAQLAALGTGSILLLALGPIFLAAITLSVAYDGRFALGLSGLLALLVTLGLGQGVGFFLVACAGLLPACLMPGEVRSRSRLIEVGGAVGVAAAAAAFLAGLARMEPFTYLLASSAWAALGGFAAGGLVLCALPFVERAFKITTGLTLLEYLDHPLLRRLAVEAPGTYNHSLQVATISEEAAKAIGADGLLCRVACYYHDVGKLRKPEYFIENQRSNEAAGRSRIRARVWAVRIRTCRSTRACRCWSSSATSKTAWPWHANGACPARSCRSSSNTTARLWSSTSIARPASNSNDDSKPPAKVRSSRTWPRAITATRGRVRGRVRRPSSWSPTRAKAPAERWPTRRRHVWSHASAISCRSVCLTVSSTSARSRWASSRR